MLMNFIITFIHIILAIIITVHVLLYKEDVKSSISWISLVFLSPFVGAILYIFFGINRVKRKALRLKQYIVDNDNLLQTNSNNKHHIYSNLLIKYKQFIHFGYKVYPQRYTFGNKITPLQNGTEAYPEMLKHILNSQNEVLILSYIFDYDLETKKFLDAFKILINRGIKIKILVDGIGTLKFFRSSIEKQLSKINGLEYGVFLPPHIPILLPFVNLRNHRKIMIIDGKIAFLGGMNLSKKNILINDINHGIIDITFKIEGPVIDQIFRVFKHDWEFTKHSKCNFVYEKNNNNIKICKQDIPARVISDGPDSQFDKIELIVHGALNMAKRKITIVTPYFLPESNILVALKMAAMKGINVELIVPERSDYKFLDYASEANFLSLLLSGVKIYRTIRPFDHSKIFIVDDEWVFIGSANWDVRSFKLHFETNIELFSHDLAKILNDIISKKKRKAKLVTTHEVQHISCLKRIRNNAYRLLTPYG
ncbi:MAG: phospholipase D-like domain-containing protein [Endomicrobium sp.]|jgi:cardiolipin synthase|nr:phospholipase D-like domain-containing protein [Endomicrobium sp.]